MDITAAMVKELRERTGAGMMECKKALQETSGDLDAAGDYLRKQGQAKAAKKAGRIAAQGVIAMASDPSGQSAAMVEVNSETDFVAKRDEFRAFADAVAQLTLKAQPKDLEALLAMPLDGAGAPSVEASRQDLILKIGENIGVRRFVVLSSAGGQLGVYCHGDRIGVLVDVKGGDAAVAKDLAMHVAASRPLALRPSDVPADLIAKEREIYTAQAAESGKPPEIVAKMVEGRVQKYLKEVALTGQPFVKDPDTSIEALLKKAGAEVLAYHRLEVGEGIEKKSENFADEVMSQIKS
jgi:elongation factor Ts